MAKKIPTINPQTAYRADLAAIHDAGFGAVAESAVGELLSILGPPNSENKQVVDLGCGSGILAARVEAAGYHVLGYDISPAMIALARKRSPRSEFRCASFLDAQLPACRAITAIGEIFCYLFDEQNSERQLWQFFHRVYDALDTDGIFLFDLAGLGRTGKTGAVRNFTETDDWACLYAASEDKQRHTLTREIISFRRVGSSYRRDHETHRLRLYEPATVLTKLRAAGFRARRIARYRDFRFPPGWCGFVARKA